MTDTLGDRIRAKRQRGQAAADGARNAAKDWAKNYIDSQITAAKSVLKTYVDNRIAKLAADNNLTNHD